VCRLARKSGNEAREPAHTPSADRPLRLNTGRVRDQWHTMTRTGKSARLAGHRPEPMVEMHRDDADRRGLSDGHIVELASEWGRAVLQLHVTDTVRPGEVFVPMHWTAQLSRAGRVNSVVNPALDPISGQPELKHTPVEIRALAMRWHGTILARRPLMLPQIAYWTRVKGNGHHAYIVAGDQPIAAARQMLSAALRASNPGPWVEGDAGLGAVIADGRLEAAMVLGEAHDGGVRDCLAPYMAIDRLSLAERNALLRGGDNADRGGEMCACFGVSCAAIEGAIADGATTLDAVAVATRAGTNCGSCRPEIRQLLRDARFRKAA